MGSKAREGAEATSLAFVLLDFHEDYQEDSQQFVTGLCCPAGHEENLNVGVFSTTVRVTSFKLCITMSIDLYTLISVFNAVRFRRSGLVCKFGC